MFRYSGIADEAGKPLDVQIKAQKELGWDAIEIRNIDGVNITDLCDEEFEKAYGKIMESGLFVSDFASQLCNWSRPISKHVDIDVDELKRAIPRMQRFGTKYIRMMSYPNAGWPEAEWRKEVIRRIKLLARIAEDGGIILAHENCNGWGGVSPENALELKQEVDSPAFQLLFDTGNPPAHGQDSWNFYSKTIDHTAYIHIKDCKNVEGKVHYAYCGDGNGSVPEILADLHKRGYDGFVSIEPHLAAIVHEAKDADDKDVAFEKYVKYGRRLMAEAEKAAGK